MATKHPRINVVAEPDMYYAIKKMSKKKGISMSSATHELIREALELYEDMYWVKLAEERDKNFDRKKAIRHKDFWKD